MHSTIRKASVVLLTLLTILNIGLLRSVYCAINQAVPKYECYYSEGEKIGKQHSKDLSGSYTSTTDIKSIMAGINERNYYCAAWLYYRPAQTEGGWSAKNYAAGEKKVAAFCSYSVVPQRASASYGYRSGDTVVFEAQTDGIGTYSCTVYAKRGGKWVDVSHQAISTEKADADTDIIAEYTILPEDQKVRGEIRYDLLKNDKTFSCSYLYMLDIGEKSFYLSYGAFLFTSMLLILVLLTSVTLLFARKAKKKML